MNERNVLVEVQNLKKWFPVKKGLPMGEKKYVKAVDDVSFQVFQGKPWAWWGSPAAENPPWPAAFSA